MRVLDYEPRVWFLLEDDGILYLDVHCSHSAVDYSVLIALDATEKVAFEKGGHSYIDRLAYDIHFSAPGVRGSRSPFRRRNLTVGPGDKRQRTDTAITAWLADQRA